MCVSVPMALDSGTAFGFKSISRRQLDPVLDLSLSLHYEKKKRAASTGYCVTGGLSVCVCVSASVCVKSDQVEEEGPGGCRCGGCS